MKADTLFNIYQSYSLAKISALNKQNLVALYAQNEQLGKLNKELAKSNSVTQQILKNQIKEIERQEKCRYYKKVSFNLSQAIGLLENETNTNFRVFASNLFLPIIREVAKESTQALEEIADKEYANAIVQKCLSLAERDKETLSDYQETSWAKIIPLKDKVGKLATVEIANKEKELQQAIEEKANKRKEANLNTKSYKGCFVTMCVITAFFLMVIIGTIVTNDFEATKGGIILFIVSLAFLAISYRAKKKNEDVQIDDKDETLQEKIISLENELSSFKREESELNSRYSDMLQEVTLDCPKWDDKLKEIASYLPKKQL